MTIHLIKLSVGSENIADLESWQKQRLRELKHAGKTPELMHITRHMPKRAAEVLDGGSIYWVINGFLCARQRLLELRPIIYNGTPHCGLVYDKEIIRVAPRPHRAFQGWRYFEPKDAPQDIQKGTVDMPDEMLRELAALGLM